jgi:hypothetical protein
LACCISANVSDYVLIFREQLIIEKHGNLFEIDFCYQYDKITIIVNAFFCIDTQFATMLRRVADS